MGNDYERDRRRNDDKLRDYGVLDWRGQLWWDVRSEVWFVMFSVVIIHWTLSTYICAAY